MKTALKTIKTHETKNGTFYLDIMSDGTMQVSKDEKVVAYNIMMFDVANTAFNHHAGINTDLSLTDMTERLNLLIEDNDTDIKADWADDDADRKRSQMLDNQLLITAVANIERVANSEHLNNISK